MNYSNNKGYTIVELIVAVMIVAILGTISFIMYFGYTESARDSARISNLEQIEKQLNLTKVKDGFFPIPEDYTEVTYLGEVIWRQGSLGVQVRDQIDFYATSLEPDYNNLDYDYSLTTDGKTYQVGSIFEDPDNVSGLLFFDTTYAKDNIKTNVIGNYTDSFLRVFVNGEYHIISVPTLILNKNENYNLTKGEPTKLFSLNKTGNLPANYANRFGNKEEINFTPRLLFKGKTPGVKSDQEIVNFIASLRESYNMEPFISNPDYKSIFDDYQKLSDNITNIDLVNEIGIKINRSLGANIDVFDRSDIFPLTCGDEDGTFEGFLDNFNLLGSCLYNYEGSGTGLVKAGVGNFGTKGAEITVPSGTGKFKYRVFPYIPTKFSFDLKTNLTGYSKFKFYINGTEYLLLKGDGENYNSGYQTYTTPLLKPGIYDFNFEVTQYNGNAEIFIDNLDFPCKGGGILCGWEEGTVETGDINPWDIFEFTGNITTPWIQSIDSSEGIYSITTPIIKRRNSTNIIYKKTLTDSAKFNFDYKINMNSGNSVKFYINGIEYDKWYASTTGTGFTTYTTSLFPAGDYTFKWTVSRNWNTDHYVNLSLDNLNFSCIGGGVGCGWEDLTVEEGNINPWDLFEFTGDIKTPWIQSLDSSEGLYSITNPTVGRRKTTNLIYNKTLTGSAKINFDYKINMNSGNSIRFYINGIEFNNWYKSTSGTGFTTYSSTLLPAGDYSFEWRISRNWNTGHYVNLWLDNINFSCIGGGIGCGLDLGFEDGLENPWDLFTFTGTTDIPWTRLTGTGYSTEGTYGITNPFGYGPYKLRYKKTLTEVGKLSFDIKTYISGASSVRFFINGSEYLRLGYVDYIHNGNYNDGFRTYTTPLLPAGDYEFSWEVTRGFKAQNRMYLDNLKWSCVGGGVGCGWYDDLGFEIGDNSPYDLGFSFTGSTKVAWNTLTGTGYYSEGLYGLSSPYILNSAGQMEMSFNKTLTGSAKFSFDIKTDISGASSIQFFINDSLYLPVGYIDYRRYDDYNSGFGTYTTPLLPAGDYEFKWLLVKGFKAKHRLFLDNLNFSCIDGVGTGCEMLDLGFEDGTNTASELGLSFTGFTKTPWMRVEGEWNFDGTLYNNFTGSLSTFGYKNPAPALGTNNYLEFTKTLDVDSNINFDIMGFTASDAFIRFYIDGVEVLDNYTDFKWENMEFPILAGTHTFKWKIHRGYRDAPYMWLDNINFTAQ